MLQEAWLCEEAAIWQNVLKYECRTGILSLHAARAEQLFTLGFWCGILLNFLWQFYSDFCLSCATAVTLLGTRWSLKFWICSLTMLDTTPTEKIYLLKTAIKKNLQEGFFSLSCPLPLRKSCCGNSETQNMNVVYSGSCSWLEPVGSAPLQIKFCVFYYTAYSFLLGFFCDNVLFVTEHND